MAWRLPFLEMIVCRDIRLHQAVRMTAEKEKRGVTSRQAFLAVSLNFLEFSQWHLPARYFCLDSAVALVTHD